MNIFRLLGAICVCVFALISTSSNAALVSRLGGQAVYDTDLNITWIADANLVASNTFGLSTGVSLGTHPSDSSGFDGTIIATGDMSMNWPGALFWIDAMNAANYLGFNDWRLPITSQPDPSCNLQTDLGAGGFPLQGSGGGCTNSEMGHLFHVEGVSLTTPGLFSNVLINLYWSSTEFVRFPDTSAWDFAFGNGTQNTAGKQSNFAAWAVRSGDVSAVPVPAAVWLFGSGLLGLIGISRRKKAA